MSKTKIRKQQYEVWIVTEKCDSKYYRKQLKDA